jgi:hypothetical protein
LYQGHSPVPVGGFDGEMEPPGRFSLNAREIGEVDSLEGNPSEKFGQGMFLGKREGDPIHSLEDLKAAKFGCGGHGRHREEGVT